MSEEVDKSIESEEQETPMEEEAEATAQQSNGDAEDDDTKEDTEEDASPKKKKGSPQKKKEEKDGGEEEDDEDEESSEEELPLGSIEAPVQIMTGKRERKKTVNFVFEEKKEKEEDKKEIKPGKGTKLVEIPNVNYHIERTKAEFWKPVHQIMFGFQVKMNMVKKNIRQFSGFPFEKDTPEFKKREQRLFKFTLVGVKELCLWLDLERGGTKEQICNRILEYLLKPEPSGRPLPEKKKKAAKKPTKKRKRKEDGSGDAKKQKKKEKKEKKSESENDTAAHDSDDSVSSLSPDSSDEEDEEPKKKKAKVEKKKTPKKTATPTPKKKKETPKPKKKAEQKKSSTPKKTPKKNTPKKTASSYESDSSDDEPLVKKKAAPSDTQIKDTIKKFLAKANLEEVTMKIVCKKVYETYPEFDLTHKKDFIKSTVKSIIS